MCDLKVYVTRGEKEELLLEAVNLIRVEGQDVFLRNLFGEEKTVRGGIREVSLAKNRVTLDPK